MGENDREDRGTPAGEDVPSFESGESRLVNINGSGFRNAAVILAGGATKVFGYWLVDKDGEKFENPLREYAGDLGIGINVFLTVAGLIGLAREVRRGLNGDEEACDTALSRALERVPDRLKDPTQVAAALTVAMSLSLAVAAWQDKRYVGIAWGLTQAGASLIKLVVPEPTIEEKAAIESETARNPISKLWQYIRANPGKSWARGLSIAAIPTIIDGIISKVPEAIGAGICFIVSNEFLGRFKRERSFESRVEDGRRDEGERSYE